MNRKYIGMGVGGLLMAGALAGCAPADYNQPVAEDTYAQQSVEVHEEWDSDCSFNRFGWILDLREGIGWRAITQIDTGDFDTDGDLDILLSDERGFLILCENQIYQKGSLND